MDFSEQTPQLMMLAGIVMLGWVLIRRQIRRRSSVCREERAHRQALRRIERESSLGAPLVDAPPQTARWQAAMHDLHRELKADLDTRIAVVQSLLDRLDARVEQLQHLEAAEPREPVIACPLSREQRNRAGRLLASGFTVEEVAASLQASVGDVELFAGMRPRRLAVEKTTAVDERAP